MAIESMEVKPPDKLELFASGVSVGEITQRTEFEYVLETNQKVCMLSTLAALDVWLKSVKKQKVSNFYETDVIHRYTLLTEKA